MPRERGDEQGGKSGGEEGRPRSSLVMLRPSRVMRDLLLLAIV
jgi:hypothetical protein